MLYVIALICAGCIAGGGYLVVQVLRRIALGVRARRWPQAIGQLVSVEDKTSSNGETQEILVRYAYRVGSRNHEGHIIHPCYSGGPRFGTSHENLKALLRPGLRVRVSFQSEQPDRSMISTGFYSSTAIALFVGVDLVAIGSFFPLTFWFHSVSGSTWGYGLGAPWIVLFGLMLFGSDDFASGITVIPGPAAPLE